MWAAIILQKCWNVPLTQADEPTNREFSTAIGRFTHRSKNRSGEWVESERLLKILTITYGTVEPIVLLQGHPLKCGFYSIFWILNKSFNGCPWSREEHTHPLTVLALFYCFVWSSTTRHYRRFVCSFCFQLEFWIPWRQVRRNDFLPDAAGTDDRWKRTVADG